MRIRILVVDDYEIIRHNICRLLVSQPEFEVVAQAGSGFEAIKQAEQYQPDVVLLDISMPELNGLAATPLIRKVSPNSKILIISNHDNGGFVREAFAAGALGFLSKGDLAEEVVTAVLNVIKNQSFLGKRLVRSEVTFPVTTATNASGSGNKILEGSHASTVSVVHSVHIYQDSNALIARLCAIVSSSLRTGDSALIIATAEHREQLLQQLQTCGLDVRSHARDRRYLMLDAREILATLMRNGKPDTKLFVATLGDILDEAQRSARGGGKRLTVFGEMVGVLWEEGHTQAALQLEALWNGVLHDRVFHRHCAYPRRSVLGDQQSAAIQNLHSHVVQ